MSAENKALNDQGRLRPWAELDANAKAAGTRSNHGEAVMQLTLGAMSSSDEAERMRKAVARARELASNPTSPDPNLPKWWEGWDKPE